ncbi:MAG TPA: PAS domain S-box protein, partial [Geobacteraceae bacterium]|nr:PAS domain S-box protein [Geobacteraceae bacterium]
KGNQELLSRLDEGLKILKENGEYREIYERWFGVYEKQDVWNAVKYYVWALAAAAGLCLAFLVWSRMLKRRVEQRTAELRRSEEALRFTQYAIDNSADYAFWMTEGGHLFYVNDAACRALGYSREELLRMSIPDIDPDFPPEVFAEHWRKLRERGSVAHESFHRSRDSRVYPVEIHDNFVVFDGKEYNCAFMSDISERKRAEESLRESEEKFRVLAETAPAGVCLYQGERIVYVNPATTRLFGYTEEECLQMRFWDWVHEDSREMARERGLARQRGESVPSRYECRHVGKDGRDLWICVSAGRIDYGGKPACIVTFFDMTDRKRMEEELRHAHDDLENRVEERTAELAETVNKLLLSQFCIDKAAIGIYQTTFEGDILSANECACRSLGYTADELRALKVHDIDPVITDEKMLDIKGMLDKSGFAAHETVHRRKDGSTFPVEIMTNQLEFEGKPYTFSFVKDITGRKRAEEFMRQANLVVENSPVVLFRWKGDDEWPVELVSGNIIQFGYTPDEFLSGSITYSSIILPDDLGRVTREVHDLCDGGADQLRLEYRIVTKGGDVRWVNEHTNVERDAAGGVKSFEGVVIDVTDRKEIELELRKNKEKYQAIVDQIDGYIYIASRDYRIQFMNESVGKLFGYNEPGEFCYKVMHDRDSVCPECRSEEVFEGKTVRREWCNPRTGRFYHVMDTPIFHIDGTIVRQTVATDITERKLAEEQLEQRKRQLEELNRTLEKRVEEEVAKNREKDIILIQQNRQAALGEMLDHIAHQWKQPLNAFSFIVQDAEATWSCGEMTDEYVSETVAKAMDLVQHMAQTVEVFRDFYRPEKEKSAFSIKDSIDRALSFISPALKFHAIALGLDIDPGLTAVGYPKEYTQVLLNIMTNARDVFVDRKTEKPWLEVKAFEEGGKAVVTITDNAGGIPDTIIGKVFDIYFTTRESDGGTGVGLYMSKNIIEKNMGGKLNVVNIDNGARFRIELNVPKQSLDQ